MRQTLVLIAFLICSNSFGQMVLSGTATGGCDCYTLTTTTSQAGSVWSPDFIDLTKTFDFTFQINLGFSDGGADGMAFVLRSTGTTTGIGGGLLGYGGITNSIAIEVDTWNNGGVYEIASDHLAMNSNGVLTHNIEPAYAIANIEDGSAHDFRVTWDPLTLQMRTFLDGTLIFNHVEDLVATIFGGNPNVRFGWSGGTGGASNIQTVCIPLESEIGVDDLNACPGQELFFTDDSECGLIYDGVGVTNWAWTFEGGGVSDLENPTHSWATIGIKTATLTVTNLIGCTDVGTIDIIVDSIDADIEGTDIPCFGFDNGTATITPLTGDAPYTFLWDDPLAQTTATAIDLPPGTYTVLVTDDVGCQIWRTVTITEPDELLIDELIIVDATCGLDNGVLTLTAMGGTLPHEYSIDGGVTFEIGATFIGLPSGDINYEIRDGNGCLLTGIATIGANDLDVTVTKVDVTCFGFDNGTATATPAFGVGPCSYLWDDPLAQTTATATGLAPGTYTVTVTHDAVGCSGTATITITEPTELIISSIASIDASCGINNGQITIEGAGGTLPYEYSIDGGGIFTPIPTFTGLAPGAYNIVIRDAQGCTVTDNVVLVNVSNVPEVILSTDYTEGCRPLAVNLVNISDPVLTDVTLWDLGDGTTFEGGSLSHTYENAGCYDIHVVITTYDGCTTEATLNDFICVWELPIAEFDFSPEQPDVVDNDVQFENLSEFASTYEWGLGDGTVDFTFEPSHAYPEIGNGLYLVQLIAISDKGCRDSAYQYVLIDEVVQYFIPNTFTPDGDAFNQTFQPVFSSIFIPQDFHFVIYNRWGEMVWESYDYTAGWDGTYGDVLVQDGVYIWQLTFKENGSDKKYDEFGHISVLR